MSFKKHFFDPFFTFLDIESVIYSHEFYRYVLLRQDGYSYHHISNEIDFEGMRDQLPLYEIVFKISQQQPELN
jgi:hypothetical protein